VSFVFSRAQRISVFIAVGWLGFALQLTALALLTSLAHWPWLPATIVAVELAVVHNFIWHERVTWCDRTAFSSFERFARFNIATGMTSIAGNIVLMAICIGVLGLPPIVANAIAVGTMSVVNFFVADRWVFAATVNSPPRRTRGTPVVVRFVAVLVLSTTASAAAPHDAVDAWNRYVVETEARFEASASSPRPADYDVRAEGASLGVPSGTISRWRGSVFIPGARLDQVHQGDIRIQRATVVQVLNRGAALVAAELLHALGYRLLVFPIQRVDFALVVRGQAILPSGQRVVMYDVFEVIDHDRCGGAVAAQLFVDLVQRAVGV